MNTAVINHSAFLSWGLVVAAAFFDSYAAIVVKYKFNEMGRIDLSSWSSFWQYMFQFVQSPLLMSAIITFCAAPGLWFLALNRLDFSAAYPVLVGLHLLCAMICGASILGETITAQKIAGTILIFFAMYLFHK